VMSWISSPKFSSSTANPTGFLLKASAFTCLNPGRCTILKLKSYNMSTHLPLRPCVSNTVANHSSGLWSVHRIKCFICKYCLKCITPQIRA
jgi:hypothetical protein